MSMIFQDLADYLQPPFCAAPSCGFYLLTGDTWAPALTMLIDSAKHSINLGAYSISARWNKKTPRDWNLYDALHDAAKRGVRCRVVLAKHKKSSATARFNLYAGAQLKNSGWNVRWFPRSTLLHAKFIVIDNTHVLLGSHNFAKSSATSNVDLSVCFSGRTESLEFTQLFEQLWSKSSLVGIE